MNIATTTAAAMLVVGSAVAAVGLRRGYYSKNVADPKRAECILRGFRIAIVGLASACVGAGWLWGIDWLVALALIIGGEELLESSVMIAALGLRTAEESSVVAAQPRSSGEIREVMSKT